MLLTAKMRWMIISQPRTLLGFFTPPGRVEMAAEMHTKTATQQKLIITQNINVLA